MSKRKSKHLPQGLPHYVDGLTEKTSGAFLIPLTVSEEGASRAIEVLKAFFRASDTEEHLRVSPEEYRKNIESIADEYWNNLSFYERDDPDGIGDELTAIHAAAISLRGMLGLMPRQRRGWLATAISKFDPAEGFRRLQGLEETLGLLTQGLLLPAKNPRGARAKTHLNVGVTRVAALWSKLNGRAFPKTFGLAPGKGGEAGFTTEPAQFIYEVMVALDPNITAQDVLHALKKMPKSIA